MAKQKSRPARWNEAIGELREKVDALQALYDEINGPLSTLKELQEEYQEWYDNMPEGLQQGPTGDLLTDIGNMDIPDECSDDTISDVISFIDEGEGIQLPQGFGRD